MEDFVGRITSIKEVEGKEMVEITSAVFSGLFPKSSVQYIPVDVGDLVKVHDENGTVSVTRGKIKFSDMNQDTQGNIFSYLLFWFEFSIYYKNESYYKINKERIIEEYDEPESIRYVVDKIEEKVLNSGYLSYFLKNVMEVPSDRYF